MPNSFLSCISYRLGNLTPLEELDELAGAPDVLERLIAGDMKHCSVAERPQNEMIKECIEETLQQAQLTPDKIDSVIYTTGADHWSIDKERLLLPTLADCGLANAAPIGVTLSGCANGNVALWVADSLVSSGAASCVLILHAEFVPFGEPRLEPPDVNITGDAVASAVVSNGENAKLKEYRFIDGYCQASSELCSLEMTDETLGEFVAANLSGIKATVNRLYERHNISAQNINSLIAPNFGSSLVKMVAMAAGFQEDQIFLDNIPRVGHVLTADGLVNLKDLEASSPMQPSEKAFVFGVGTFNWSVAYLEKV